MAQPQYVIKILLLKQFRECGSLKHHLLGYPACSYNKHVLSLKPTVS